MSLTSGDTDDETLVFLATRQLSIGSAAGHRRVRHAGLAVSGGGDSMAMLHLVAPWALANGIAVSAATVDHGLRPESPEEARFVASACAALGVPHATLRWEGWNGRGNLQAAARAARRELLAGWAKARGADAVLLAHTGDDQAETFLLRLARGSGVDGLAAMPEDWRERGLRWMRPLLGERREDLRSYLRRHGHAWVDDPSNADERFARVRARRALDALAPLGITVDRLRATAWHMSLARDALEHLSRDAADRVATQRLGDVAFALGPYRALPMESQLRLLAGAIRWVSGSDYRPRLHPLLRAWLAPATHDRPPRSPQRALGGTILRWRGEGEGARLLVTREPRAAARALSVPTAALWDGRWRLSGPHAPDLRIRMLGEEGIALCPDWRATGLERGSVLAGPAVWRGPDLVAAPLAGRPEGWTAEVATDFHAFLRLGSRPP